MHLELNPGSSKEPIELPPQAVVHHVTAIGKQRNLSNDSSMKAGNMNDTKAVHVVIDENVQYDHAANVHRGNSNRSSLKTSLSGSKGYSHPSFDERLSEKQQRKREAVGCFK